MQGRLGKIVSKVGPTFSTVRSKLSQLSNKVGTNDGRALESQVASLLRKEGYKDVQLNTRVKDLNGNWSEIDVIGRRRSLRKRFFHISRAIPYGNRQIFVECKQYSQDNRVGLAEVSKFKEVCQLNNIALDDALFVTTSSYAPRATTIGINTVDGIHLRKWKRANITLPPVMRKVTRVINITAMSVATILYSVLVLELREARAQVLPYQAVTDGNERISDGLEPITDDAALLRQFQTNYRNYGRDGIVISHGEPFKNKFNSVYSILNTLWYGIRFITRTLLRQETATLKYSTHDPNSVLHGKRDCYYPLQKSTVYTAFQLFPPLPTTESTRCSATKYILEQNNTHESQIAPLLELFYKVASSHDNILFKYQTSSGVLRSTASSISSRYCYVDEGGYTVLKLPVHHALSVPGYFSKYSLFRLYSVKKWADEIFHTMEKAHMNSNGNNNLSQDRFGTPKPANGSSVDKWNQDHTKTTLREDVGLEYGDDFFQSPRSAYNSDTPSDIQSSTTTPFTGIYGATTTNTIATGIETARSMFNNASAPPLSSVTEPSNSDAKTLLGNMSKNLAKEAHPMYQEELTVFAPSRQPADVTSDLVIGQYDDNYRTQSYRSMEYDDDEQFAHILNEDPYEVKKRQQAEEKRLAEEAQKNRGWFWQ